MALKWKVDAVGTTGGKATVATPMVDVQPYIEPEVLLHKVLVQSQQTAVELLTSEYLELWKKYDYFEVKNMVKRMEEIRKELVSIANDTMEGNKPAIFSSPQGEIEFSERNKVTEVPDPLGLIALLQKKFGAEATASVVDIALTPLRKLLSESELKAYLKEEPGGRTLKAVRPM